MSHVALVVASGVALARLAPAASGAEGILAFPESAGTVAVFSGGEPYIEIAFVGWGPRWSWMGLRGEVREVEGGAVLANTAKAPGSGARITLDAKVAKTGPRRLRIDVDLSADRDAALTYIVAAVGPADAAFAGGRAVVTLRDGRTKEVALPFGKKGLGEGVAIFALEDARGRRTVVTLDPPCDVPTDGPARVVLAGDSLRAGAPRRTALTIDFPADLTYLRSTDEVPDEPGLEDWYEFRPGDAHSRPSEIGMQGWIEKPAGKHGRIVRREDKLIYNGRPIKLWGLNVCYASCAPDRALAEKRAAFYEKHGVNAVRLHKYADGPGWAGIQSKESFIELDPEALDRMDYFVAKLKEHGIYTKLSSTFGVKLGPADRERVPYMDEFGRGKNRIATGHGSVFLSRELQDMQIRQIVKVLEHRNPHTGMTYARDPAIAVVELFNEDSALFYGTMSQLQKIPTLRRRASELFSDWLTERYRTEEALVAAWGPGGLDSFKNERLIGESLAERTIVPAGNPWFYDPDQLAGSQKPKRQRLLDTMLFLYELQNGFYSRYVKAIRDTGYEGEILASNWQAGRAMSHYYNLHSDYLVGLIDRHNYFGGGGGTKIKDATMLRAPGSGMLSAGMQQVRDRPFMLSEWIHVSPNEWGVEGPAIIGAYAMGLQGWDVSYMFQNRDEGRFSDRVGRDRWDVTAPQVMGVFPAVARQVHRGDVKESEVVATRYVHVPSLHEGRLGFEDRMRQQHDVKTFDCDKVPARSLAAARCVVEFTEEYLETPRFDLGRYHGEGVIESSTRQLRWKEGASRLDGFFTIDTDATKAVVGFAKGETCRLGDVTILPRSRFAAIYVTAAERDAEITTSRRLLVVAVARARNKGMKVFMGDRLLAKGGPPVLMEPVRAEITVRERGRPTVHVLDHAGCRTGRTLEVADGRFTIDGARDRTCYYLIEY
jgi:hypothetical protein